MYFHGGNLEQIERQTGIQKENIIDFSCNTNPLGFPSIVNEIIKEKISSIASYPDIDYYNPKKAIAKYCKTDQDNIILGNGAVELIHLYINILKPGKALILAPTFCEYEKALSNEKCQIDYFQLKEKNEFYPDLPHLFETLANNYDLLIICNPNNPTSGYINKKDLTKIIETAKQYQTKVMLDESFIDFISPDNDLLEINNNFKNLFILRSLTKFFCIPGLRLGYGLIFDLELKNKISQLRSPWSINSFSAAIGEKLYSQEKYINQTKQLIANEKQFLYNELLKLKGLSPFKPAVNFILIKLNNKITAEELQKKLLKRNILIRNAANFKFLNDSFIRIAIKDHKSNIKLLQALNSELK